MNKIKKTLILIVLISLLPLVAYADPNGSNPIPPGSSNSSANSPGSQSHSSSNSTAKEKQSTTQGADESLLTNLFREATNENFADQKENVRKFVNKDNFGKDQ